MSARETKTTRSKLNDSYLGTYLLVLSSIQTCSHFSNPTVRCSIQATTTWRHTFSFSHMFGDASVHLRSRVQFEISIELTRTRKQTIRSIPLALSPTLGLKSFRIANVWLKIVGILRRTSLYVVAIELAWNTLEGCEPPNPASSVS